MAPRQTSRKYFIRDGGTKNKEGKMHGFYTRAELDKIGKKILGERIEGRPDQSVHEVSTIQNFIVGSERSDRGRKFRYSFTVAALTGLDRLVINTNYAPGVTGHLNEDGFEGAGGVNAYAAPIGQNYIDIKDTALRAKNWYQGGMVIVYGTLIFHQHYIVASDAGNGTYVRLYLDHPITTEAITAGMGVTAYRSRYSAVGLAGSVQTGFESFVGLPLIPAPISNYFWLQTGGPACVTPTGVTWPGSAVNLRDIYANPADGTIQPPTLSDPSLGYQRIGTLIEVTGGTAGDYGDLWIDLQLDQ